MTGFDADDATRHLLGAADPARSLPPADADALATILEDTMSQSTDHEPARRGPSRLVLLGGAAAAMVAIAVGIGISQGNDDEPGTPAAGPSTAGTVTAIGFGPAIAAKCAQLSAADLRSQDLAFEGTVTDISNGVVTLDPSHFYQGAETDKVTVAEPDTGISELPVTFEVGKAYIVGATDGRVSICGAAGLATDELRAQYDAAFAQ